MNTRQTPTDLQAARLQRIAKEDEEYRLYGKPLMERWLTFDVPAAVGGHRKRGTRKRATDMGKWLCEKTTLAWLEAYGIRASDFLDVQYTRHMKDGSLMIGITTVQCGRVVKTRTKQRWEVRMEGPFPGCTVDGKLIGTDSG